MNETQFQPGFRISWLDGIVLALGAVGSIAAWQYVPWLGLAIGFVVGHFFLFCNVVRMARPLELVWSAVFLGLAAGSTWFDVPRWPITFTASCLTTIGVVWLEMRKPSYHGVGWQKLNPNLPKWWADHRRPQAPVDAGSQTSI